MLLEMPNARQSGPQRADLNGNVNSVEWNDGMERWSGLLEWSSGLDYWSATPTKFHTRTLLHGLAPHVLSLASRQLRGRGFVMGKKFSRAIIS